MKHILLTGVLAAAAWAQDGIRGPVPGFVFDEQAKALRPMIGVPGASYLGGAIANDLENASVSPDGRLALAVRGGKMGLLDLSGVELRWTELAAAGRVRIAWSGNSTSAAVWNEDGRIDLWNGLKESARAAALGRVENVTALAVDARGVVAAASADGVYRLEEGGNAEMLARVQDASALALDSTGATLYVASRGGNQVLELADWRNSGGAAMVANENAGILAPGALAISNDGRRLIVANEASLVMIDRATRAVTQTMSLEFRPSRLEKLADGNAWLLNSREQGQPLEVLSAGPDAKVFFVPVEE